MGANLKSDIMKVGQSISYRASNKMAKKGRAFYESQDFNDTNVRTEYTPPTEKVTPKDFWKNEQEQAELSQIGTLQEKLCKDKCKILFGTSSPKVAKLAHSMFTKMGFLNISISINVDDFIKSAKENQYNIIYSSYRFFNDDRCGRVVYNELKEFYAKKDWDFNYQIASDYTHSEQIHLQQAKIPVLLYGMGRDKPQDVYNEALSITSKYYIKYVIETLFGRDKAKEFEPIFDRISDKHLSRLEALLSKRNYKCLVVQPNEAEASVLQEVLKRDGFTEIEYATSSDQAISLIDSGDYDVVLSAYRLEDVMFSDANKISSHIKNSNIKSKFVIVNKYVEGEVDNLKRSGIRVVPKSDNNFEKDFTDLVNIYWIQKLKKLLIKGLR